MEVKNRILIRKDICFSFKKRIQKWLPESGRIGNGEFGIHLPEIPDLKSV
jgi:hypothetical protein